MSSCDPPIDWNNPGAAAIDLLEDASLLNDAATLLEHVRDCVEGHDAAAERGIRELRAAAEVQRRRISRVRPTDYERRERLLEALEGDA